VGTAAAWLNPAVDSIRSDDPRTPSEAILRAVLHSRVGVALVGTQEDRRAVLGTVIDRLRAERPVFHLHGSAFIADVPYGALSILQARSEIRPEATWFATTNVLGEFLSPAGSGTAVVILSEPHLMDRDSVTVLSQLAHQRRAHLVVQCEHPLELPADLAALARTGGLEQVTVRPVTPEAARTLLAAHLGSPVSRVLATVLWRRSDGHVGRLAGIADACVDSGKVALVDGQWLLNAGPMPAVPASAGEDVVLRRMPGSCRELLERLATRAWVPVGELVRGGDAADLDALTGLGIVRVQGTSSGRVATVTPTWRTRVRGAMDPARRQELDGTAGDRSELLRVVLGAEDRLADVDTAGALALLDAVRRVDAATDDGADHPLRTATRWIRARVLVATGELAAARRMLADVDDTGDPSLQALRATVAALGTGQDEARSWLEGERQGWRHLRLDPGATGRSWEAIHLRAEATRALVLAMGARQAEARALSAQVAEQMTRFRGLGVLDTVMSAYDRAMISQLLLEAHLCCGDLDDAVDLAETILTARHGNPQAVQFAELVLAVVEVLTGRLEEGGASAARVVAQSWASGDRCVLQVARALLAFCRGSAGAVELAGPAPDADDGTGAEDPSVGWGRLGWLAQVLRAATPRLGEPAGSAEARLVDVADRARAADLGAVEQFALLGAGLMGEAAVADRLAEVAAATQAAASAPAAELAAALASGDPERYGAALGGLVTARHTLWQEAGLARVADRLPRGTARRLADLASRRRGDAAPTERVP
jgi:hypothetical protein